MDQRRIQLRQAKQRQRERDRAAGLVLYQTYGDSVLNLLNSALDLFADSDYRKQCVTELEVRNKRTLDLGLRSLTGLLQS